MGICPGMDTVAKLTPIGLGADAAQYTTGVIGGGQGSRYLPRERIAITSRYIPAIAEVGGQYSPAR